MMSIVNCNVVRWQPITTVNTGTVSANGTLWIWLVAERYQDVGKFMNETHAGFGNSPIDYVKMLAKCIVKGTSCIWLV